MSDSQAGRPVLIWDWPARVVHWGFSVSLTVALLVGFLTDPEGPLFRWHILAAYLAVWFLGLRVVLGFAGSRYLRLSALFCGPPGLFRYLGSVMRWERETLPGLNPGSAAFALGIYGCLVALVYSGFVAELVETWHGRLAYGASGLIVVHLAGLFLHALRHRAPTPLAMFHGRVSGRLQDGLQHASPGVGFLLMLLSGAVLWALVAFYDEANAVVAIPGLPEIPVPTVQKG
jgi:cytochrome b